MNKYEQLVIMNEHDGKHEKNILTAIDLLLSTGHILTVRTELSYDEQVIIEYQKEYNELGCAYPYWLYPEEYENVEVLKNE